MKRTPRKHSKKTETSRPKRLATRARRATKPAAAPAESNERPFAVVGVGASAGGLEAFRTLLENLPIDTGMAFVLVQHLDPGHPSALTQLLARATTMPVSEVTQNLPAEPNRIYVIPPNTAMAISGGILKLRPRQRLGGLLRSIDFFFESLAADQGERAIGVVLSGTASDGTAGLEAIKAEGGITFAQDDSAKYDSMPRSAVGAGCVDFVLPPERISRELAEIARHPFVVGAHPGVGPVAESAVEADRREHRRGQAGEGRFRKILVHLRNHSGVDFSLYKTGTIYRRINRRMVLNKFTTLDEYATFLRGNTAELDALFSDLLISVTAFFRNPDAFDSLKRSAFPVILQEKNQDSVRVWVLGCSTGQEAYSIAMTYLEYADRVPNPPKLQVFATDLHDGSLEKARSGFYTKSMVQDVSPERLRRFFTDEEGGYRINKSLRDSVIFARQNALSDPPFSRMDLISCRNMLIYLEPNLQHKLIPTFHYALKPNGFLFLGASESIGGFTDLFQAVDKKHRIFSRKSALTPPLYLHTIPFHPAERKVRPSKPPVEIEGSQAEVTTQREADRITLSQYAPPSVLVSEQFEIIQFRGDTSPYLKAPSGKASFDLLKMAREGLMMPLRAAISKARKENREVHRDDVQVVQHAHQRRVNIKVVPLKNLKERSFLIFFSEPFAAPPPRSDTAAAQPGRRRQPAPLGDLPPPARRIAELERELAETRDYVQSVQEQYEASNEELQASNEEVTSANEELQSINEELETSKEELEATNEELTTVNEELSYRNVELGRVNSDLINFQSAANMAILLLDADLGIRRFTSVAAKQFNLIATDVGRAITEIRHNLDIADLDEFIRGAIDRTQEREQEVRDKHGRWYSLRVRPYLSLERKIEGAVVTLVDIDALKRTAQEIAEAREYAEAIVRTASDSLLVLNADLTVHSANEAFYKTFRGNPTNTEQRLIYHVGDGQWDIPALRELLEEILPRNSFFTSFEVTHHFKEIGTRTMLLNARALHDPNGHPGRILLGIRDATEQVESEARVRRSEVRFRRLFEAAKDGIILVNPETQRIADANPYIADLLGLSREEMLDKELHQVSLCKDRPACQAMFQRLRQTGQARQSEVLVQAATGEKREIEMVSNLYSEEGHNIVQCNLRDITEQRAFERQIMQRANEQQELYRLADRLTRATTYEIIYQAAMDAIIGSLGFSRAAILLFDEKGRMRFKAWRGLSDAYRRAADGHSPWSPDTRDAQAITIEDASRAKVPDELREALRNENVGALAFIPLAYQGRLLGKFMVYGDEPHRFSDDELQLAQNIANQLAFALERKRNEDDLHQAKDWLASQARQLESLVSARTQELSDTNKQLEAFIYTIAHDLRAPLRAMQGFSALLLEEAGPNISELGRDYALRVGSAAQFMDALLLDLLTFSRISQQRTELNPLALEPIVATVLSRLQPDITKKQARVENTGSWPLVVANEATLTQALFNLVSNALKFVAPGVQPVVSLRTEDCGQFLRVWVEDNGIGIAPEHQKQIFRLFTRLHGEDYAGTGLGLAIVEKGIEQMGGRVGLESKAGEGSRFWFELRKA